MYGLYGLKHHKVEMSPWRDGRTDKQQHGKISEKLSLAITMRRAGLSGLMMMVMVLMVMVMTVYVRFACTKCSSDKWCFSATKPIPSKDLYPMPFYA